MDNTITTILAEARAKSQNYPQYAYLLWQSGIHTYTVEVPTHLITYRGNQADQQWVVPGAAIILETSPSPHPFDEAGVKAALKANQEGKTDFETFLKQIWQSGITQYDADLQERKVTYRGATGKVYAEHFPLAVVK